MGGVTINHTPFYDVTPGATLVRCFRNNQRWKPIKMSAGYATEYWQVFASVYGVQWLNQIVWFARFLLCKPTWLLV